MTPVPRVLQLRGMPSPIALAATWDPALVARVYAAAAAEASAGGATLVLGPSLAVGRDPRRGRIEETFGEDPFLVGQLGISALEGLQGTLVKGRLATGKVLAAPTGFAGPGLPRDAAGTAPMAERELRSVYIAPFAEAIGRAHVAAIVPSRNMLDGVPSHANPWLLRHVLREELGFTGTVIADPEGVGDLSKAYHVARDEKDAARLARDAGVDAFDSGAALAQTVANARPKATKADAAAFGALSLEAAQASIVLLANDGALPLPLPTAGRTRAKIALLDAGAPSEFAAALRARARDRVEWVDARAADRVIVIAANDPAALRRTLDEAASAGRPIVVVLASDRPSVDADTSLRANALVAAWNLGPMGAKATAAVLFGDANPSGKLPLTLARSPGELPLFHDAKPSSQLPYLFDDGKPLYAFGFGLSYTAFEVSVPKVAKARVPEGAPVAVSVEVRNTGARRGEETVQVYVRDKVSTVTTPVIRLAGFRKIALGPGEKRTVKFSIAATRLALWDGAMHHVVEPGEFEVLAGSDSAHLRGAAVTVLAKGSR